MLENLDQVMNRMNQIERRMSSGMPPGQSSADFQRFMRGSAPAAAAGSSLPKSAADKKLNELSGFHMLSAMGSRGGFDPSALGASAAAAARSVVPLAQSNPVSCGQTSVAMCINALTGKHLKDTDINRKFGFGLLHALNSETKPAGYQWRDAGNLSASAWNLIDHKVNDQKLPVIVALNGPQFSPDGRGHIVTIVKTDGDKVYYADPATGRIKTTTKETMDTAPEYPQGNFIFYAVNDRQPDSLSIPSA